MTTRRDILVALLGLSFARCRPRAAEPRYSGGFVTRAMEDGHRLRDRFRPPPPPPGDRSRQARVIVIGAGISGLAAAWQLARAGIEDVLILELEHEPGGTSWSGRSEVTAYPWGAHYLPAPRASNRDLIELLRETGTVIGDDRRGEPIFEETQLCAAPKERIYFRGVWHEGLFPRAGASAGDLEQLERFEREIEALVARRAFALPVRESSFDDPVLRELDRISMSEWLRARKIDSPLVGWLVEYACRDDFGAEPAEVSAWYGLHYFAARKYAAGEESAEFLTWPEGNGFFVDHFLRRIGREKVLTELLVTGVDVLPDGARVTAWSTREKSTRTFTASRVIAAVPGFVREKLSLGATHPTKYAPWLVANIHLRDRPGSHGYPPSWDNVIYGSRSLGYVTATHQRFADRGVGPTVWTYYLPFTGADAKAERAKLASLSWKEAADAIVTELAVCHDGFLERVERIDIARWGHGMVRPIAGAAHDSRRAAAARPVGPIHFAHTDLSGVALFEEAFDQGTRAAREVITALRGG